jgi:hypothetical membrane protein
VTGDRLTKTGRWLGLGLVIGPATFVAAWAIGSVRRPGYSAVHDAISRLAELGSSQRPLMTMGFVVYAVGLLVGAVALKDSRLARCWPAAAVNSLATLAVALLPLGRSSAGDTQHAIAAVVGYLSIAALPALAAGPLGTANRPAARTASIAVSILIAACLLATIHDGTHGAFQRAGLTIGDAYLITLGLARATNHPSLREPRPLRRQ